MGSRLTRLDKLVAEDLESYRKRMESERGQKISSSDASLHWWKDLKFDKEREIWGRKITGFK